MSQLTSDKRYNSILKIIDEHLLPDSDAKKVRGEVFTPPQSIREILFGLKKSDIYNNKYNVWGLDKNGNFMNDTESNRLGGIPSTIWQNPESTFLDSANGIGNFPIIAFYRLDYELRTKIKDDTKRRKHIIEHMLFMIEIDKGNCETCRSIFKKICPTATPNICCRDTLTLTDDTLLKEFGINRFDIIMGNPPFQLGKNSNFYVKFIKFSIEKLKNRESYLAFVIPNRILIPEHEANKAILNINPFFILHSLNNRYFNNIATKICGVVANNIVYQNKTLCVFANGILDINLKEPTPTDYDDINTKKISDLILLKKQEYLKCTKNNPNEKYIFIKRQWERYSPLDGNKKTHVFQEIAEKNNQKDGRFYLVYTDLNKDNLKWYLTQSQIIRFISLLYASSMNVPPFLWNIIPKVSLNTQNDNLVYKQLKISSDNIDYINKIMKEGKFYSKKEKKTLKKTKGNHNKTRKNK